MKRRIQKWLGALLAGVLTVGAAVYTAPAVQAEEASEQYEETMELYSKGEVPALDIAYARKTGRLFESGDDSSLRQYQTFSGVEQVLYNGMLNTQTSIDISSYQLTRAQVKAYMQNIVNCSPELFYVDSSYITSMQGSLVIAVKPTYTATGSTLAQQKNEYNAGVDSLVKNVKSSWSSMEKVLYVHDYLAQNYEYDTSYQIYDAYQFFKQKKGVCQAYTAAFMAAMNRLGIPCTVATSESMNHIWNLVQIDGAWYHVDVTWDDPLYNNNDDFGMAYHFNLLLSDAAIEEEQHYDWAAPYTCSKTTYDNAFWQNSNSPFQYLKDRWYYTEFDESTEAGYLLSCQFAGTTQAVSEVVLEIGIWYADETTGSYWRGVYSGLSVFGDRVYFNDAYAVYSYEPASQEIIEEYRPTESGSIYGMRIDNSILYYAMAASATDKTTIYSKKISSYHDPVVPVTIYGDVDASGSVDLKDAQLALQAALRIIDPNENVRQFMDVDGVDGITLKDAQLILRYALRIIKEFPVEATN